MRKILVLRGGALGDFIVTLPALASLRARWPDARIELVGNARAAGLALSRGLLDVAHSQDEARWSALFANASLPAALVSWLGEFDLVLNYWPDPDGELARKFPVRAMQLFLTQSAQPVIAPAAAHFCEPLRKHGIRANSHFYSLLPVRGRDGSPSRPRSPALERDGEDASERRPYLTAGEVRSIAVHPGSGSAKKNWPAVRWRTLLASLSGPKLLILGEAEQAGWKNSNIAAGDLELAVNLPLEQLVARLAGCRLFLGHDSGVSHLAAACGVPCVLLFGPTDPAVWAPPAPKVTVLRRGANLNAIAVADVERAVAEALGNQT